MLGFKRLFSNFIMQYIPCIVNLGVKHKRQLLNCLFYIILALSEILKYENVVSEGKYIGVRQYYNYFINLYLLDDTFYEVWYFRPTNEIEKIEKLDDENKLNLYISSELKTKQKP